VSSEHTRRPEPLRGAAARAARDSLFTTTLTTGILLFLAGLSFELIHWGDGLPSATLFGRTVRLPMFPIFWVSAVYPFTLAARAIWLPDHRLRAAERNSRLLMVSVLTVVAIFVVVKCVIN
jgi:hypothetical protein